MYSNSTSLEAPPNGALWVGSFKFSERHCSSLWGLRNCPVMRRWSKPSKPLALANGFVVTGLIEFGSAMLLLIPALSGLGAIFLVPTMIGAILTQLLIIGENAALPIGLLIIAGVVAWGRKETTLQLIRRIGS
jgi:hypothetical protein